MTVMVYGQLPTHLKIMMDNLNINIVLIIGQSRNLLDDLLEGNGSCVEVTDYSNYANRKLYLSGGDITKMMFMVNVQNA